MIEVNGLTKIYDGFRAVDNVDLVAKGGKVTILLGPNGAGKSTTIKSIANLLKFDGEIKICGYPNDSIEEHIDFIGNAYRVDNYHEIANKYLELFKLTGKRKSMAKELSKGMTQKLSMLLALLIQPQALLVDEPMVGLDPASIEDVLKIFTLLKEEGCAVFVSTHIIDIIKDIYDEAYIMNKGKIIKHVLRDELEDESLKQYFFELTDGE